MEEIDKIISDFRIQQQRFAYYIVAVNIACIAYCIDKSLDIRIELINLPLGASILLFAISTFLGLRFIKIVLSSYASDIDIKTIQKGVNPTLNELVVKFDRVHAYPEAQQFAMNTIIEVTKKKSRKATSAYSWMMRTLYIGILFFVTWRVLVAYDITFGITF